jgi:UDP-N-acetylglucosamine 2-epimerase (non-hydrolysing)
MHTLFDIILVVGTRPNFMKVAPIARAIAAGSGPFRSRLVHTGQHYDSDMSGVFLQQLGLTDMHAFLGVGSGTHGSQTARVLEAFEAYLLAQTPRPRGVIVVGDVNSTLACALAAVKLGIPVAHVEAGLRSGDRSMPEEINRIMTDAIADLLFASEPSGVNNLMKEGVPPHKIIHVGNVMIDSLVTELSAARALGMLGRFGLQSRQFALATLHRPSNVDDAARLTALADFLLDLSERIPVVFPVHPRTRARLREQDLLERLERSSRLHLTNPLGYREHLGLMAEARLVLTDSGGIQEETSYLTIPCLTLRTTTERPVTVIEGTNTLVGADLVFALKMAEEILGGIYKAGGRIDRWDGRASERIVTALTEVWG